MEKRIETVLRGKDKEKRSLSDRGGVLLLFLHRLRFREYIFCNHMFMDDPEKSAFGQKHFMIR